MHPNSPLQAWASGFISAPPFRHLQGRVDNKRAALPPASCPEGPWSFSRYLCGRNNPALSQAPLHHLEATYSLPPTELNRVERMNQTLKSHLKKLCQKTNLHWDKVLPIALLRTRSAPTKKMGLSPYEVIYGRPLPLIRGLRVDLKEIRDLTLRQQLKALGSTLQNLNQWVQERLPISLTTEVHPFKPRDSVWVKKWNLQPLKPLWRGPFTTPMAVKVAKITPWIHHSRMKPAAARWNCTSDLSEPLKITLQRKTASGVTGP